MISKDKIFGLFENNENSQIDIHNEFMDNPYVKIGMFNKIIQNNEIFFYKLKKYYINNNIPHNEDNIGVYTQFVTYNRAFFYINQIDVDNKVHVDSLLCYDSNLLIANLNKTLMFFEGREEYEKCAHIFKIIKVVEDF